MFLCFFLFISLLPFENVTIKRFVRWSILLTLAFSCCLYIFFLVISARVYYDIFIANIFQSSEVDGVNVEENKEMKEILQAQINDMNAERYIFLKSPNFFTLFGVFFRLDRYGSPLDFKLYD